MSDDLPRGKLIRNEPLVDLTLQEGHMTVGKASVICEGGGGAEQMHAGVIYGCIFSEMVVMITVI